MEISQLRGHELPQDWQRYIELKNQAAFDWTTEMTQTCIGQDQVVFVVGHKDATIMAYLMGYCLDSFYDIIQIYVDETYRQQGVGSQLLRYVQEEMAIEEIILEVRESNVAAIHLYASQGFETIGRRSEYYHDPQEDALIMLWKGEEASCIHQV